jgi:hypothetical protein
LVTASQLRHWAVLAPPALSPGGQPFRQLTVRFYPHAYEAAPESAALVAESQTAADGTTTRRIRQDGQVCVEEEWAVLPAWRELAAPENAGYRPLVRRGPLCTSTADARAAAEMIGTPEARESCLPLVALSLAEVVRARDTRLMAALRVCLPAGTTSSADDVASLALISRNLPWGAIEFELAEHGVVIGKASAALSCGPRRDARTQARTNEESNEAGI